MRIIGRPMFNGGFLWEREPRMMKNCIIIVGHTNGNVIMQTQNNGLKSFLSLFFSSTSNTLVNSIISICALHEFNEKINLDATNNNSFAL